MEDMLYDFSEKISTIMENLDRDSIEYLMMTSNDLPAILCFYGSALIIDDDILSYENETLQLILLRHRITPKIIEKSIMAKTLIASMDNILTVPEYFKVASDVFCDSDVETGIVDWIEPARVIWTIIILMAIYHSNNIPLAGDALRYAVACLKSDGWTMPPYMLNIQKFSDFFEYYDKKYYDTLNCSDKDLLTVCGTNNEKDPINAKVNFMESHKPILQYVYSKTNELKTITKSITR